MYISNIWEFGEIDTKEKEEEKLNLFLSRFS